ncbi:MAG: diacylglycerol kinase family lipid kinase [Candidatus Dormibacteraeota bacterium]|nr:diacylglycerol kinase family lipid kinase [Candidatus Dormibacteraeota bacterium]
MSTPYALRTLVVVNPASAGGSTMHRWGHGEHMLHALGIAFDVHVTTAPGSATGAVRDALRDGMQRVVAIGGDGTLNEVVNGFFDEHGAPLGAHAALCLVTSGSGGDFARTAHIPRSQARALRALLSGRTRTIDAGRIDFADGSLRFFVNVADCGVGGEVVARVNRSRVKGGGMRGSAVFLYQSLATLLQYSGLDVAVTVDGRLIERRVQSVVVANGRYIGGGMRIAPDAELDDGLFDVVIVESAGRLKTIRGVPSLYRGTHVRRPQVEVCRARQVRIDHGSTPLLFDVEGEQVGQTGATITCLPGALRLCVERNSEPQSAPSLVD